MTYFESAENEIITAKRARYEIEENHGCSWSEFLEDVPKAEFYDAQAVLSWLGY